MYDKIIFFVSSLSQPRAIRRVESIAALGYNVEVYGYDRSQYDCNKFSSGIRVTVLGQMAKGGGYRHKFKQIKQDIARVLAQKKDQSCLFYSFGYIESVCLLINKVPYAYEISDIAYSGWGMSKFLPFFKWLDRKLVSKSEFTLMTSEGFKKFLDVKKNEIIIQPNKVNRRLLKCDRNVLDKKDNSFVFSFAGSIRYDSMLRFAEVVGKYFPQHQFHFYGVASIDYTQKELDRLVLTYPNIKLFGAFRNPDDFEKIYNSVDVIVVTYGDKSLNEKILDPNKLYEGILFCRPLIATEGTFLASQIDKYKCGINIDSSTEESIKRAIQEITVEQLNEISLNESRIKREEVFDDMANLSNVLEYICNKK